MCYHKSLTAKLTDLEAYYQATASEHVSSQYSPYFHENGFDFKTTPIIATAHPNELVLYNWGLIPWWSKSLADGIKLRLQTLNCISEEMYDKPSFRDAAKDGQRCLIPCTSFFEWQWRNPDDKKTEKIPHNIHVKGQTLFSIAGIYSKFKDKASETTYLTYTVLTTVANKRMAEIHNSKKRMPVIIPREYEKDWLNPMLTKDDVLALCRPIDTDQIQDHTISKLITSKKENTDVPQVLEPLAYPEQTSLL